MHSLEHNLYTPKIKPIQVYYNFNILCGWYLATDELNMAVC